MSRVSSGNPFWQTTSVLLKFKRQLCLALVAVIITAVCFGGGLGMMLPTLHLLLGKKQPLNTMIQEHLGNADRPVVVQEAAAWLSSHVPTQPFPAFLMVMATIAVFTVIGSIGRYLHELTILSVVARANMVWRSRLFQQLLFARMDQMLNRNTSDYISRVMADTNVMGSGYQALLGKAVAKSFNGAAALLLAFWLDWRLTLIALIGVPLIVLLLRRFGKRIRRASRRLLQAQGRMISILSESLVGIRVVKVHNAEGYERRRFSQLNRKVYYEQMRMRQVRALSSPVVETLGLFGVMSVASIAAWYIFQQNVAPERFMTVLITLGTAAATLKTLSSLNNKLQEASAAATRIMDVLSIGVEPTGRRSTIPRLAKHERDIVFDNVNFTYSGQRKPAVNDVSLRIQHGQTLAVVGVNGSGKTTLMSFVPRLLEPTAGCVRIDGVDIATVSLRSLRQQIAVVTQQTVLFEGTVAANIAYGRLYESRDKIVAAGKAAHAHEFIIDLPQGYDTMLGEGGDGLSGGQKQRVCIARAILRNPTILILDEATSQIDTDSEAKINEALNELRHGRTTLVIAHRLSTVIDADQIAVMADGQLIDRGTHTELLERCGTYQTLTHSQLQPTAT